MSIVTEHGRQRATPSKLGAPDPGDRYCVGRSVPPADGRERVTGRAPFNVDVEVQGALHAKVFRATAAHAHIRSLDVREAERVTGVLGVLTGADLNASTIKSHYGPIFRDRPIVAIDRVRYAGEPVAVVIARDVETAASALELIDVHYEHLPAYFEPEAAVEPGAFPLHESLGDRDFVTYPDLVLNPAVGSNILNHFKIRKGNVDAGLAEAEYVFADTYRTPALQHVSLEPHVAICKITDRQATVWTSASSPFTARFQVAETLGLPQSNVQVLVANIGGAYGGKSYPRIEPVVAAASWKVGGQPVRLEFTRAEEFYTICRHSAVVELTTGVRSDGTLCARKVRILWSAGAYADISPRVVKNGGYAAVGPYRIPNAWVDSYAVYTNVTPAGGFRGYGVPQVAWAYESQLDEIANELGIDRLEIRRRNLLRDGDEFATGQVMTDLHYLEMLEHVAEGLTSTVDDEPPRSSQRRRPRGVGVAAIAKGTVTPSTSTATLRLELDGSLVVLAGTTEIGQGARTVLAQIAAECVGVSFERVTPVFPDTQHVPWDQTTSSSRSTMSMGGAIQQAAVGLQEQLRDRAASLLRVDPGAIGFVLDGVCAGDDKEMRLSFGDVVRATGAGALSASGTYVTVGHLDDDTGQGIATSALFQGVAGAEVAVDLETGVINVLNLRVAAYAGRVVHPTFAELQCEGNAAFGIGAALFEQMVIVDGQVANAGLGDYMIASIEDMPRRLDVLLHEGSAGVRRVYGLGESVLPAVAPAIANAVHDACGVRARALPLTPERILRALRATENGATEHAF